MERYSMHIYWKKQYCKNVQSYLQIQCNPYQNTTGIFHRNRTNVLQICMQPQKTSNSLSNFEKEQIWRHYALCFQTILQSSGSQNSYGIGLKKTHRSVEQNRKTQIHEHMTKVLRIYSGEKIICSIKYVGETGQPHAKKKKKRTGTHSYTIHKS